MQVQQRETCQRPRQPLLGAGGHDGIDPDGRGQAGEMPKHPLAMRGLPRRQCHDGPNRRHRSIRRRGRGGPPRAILGELDDIAGAHWLVNGQHHGHGVSIAEGCDRAGHIACGPPG